MALVPSFLFSAMLLGRNALSQEQITETLVQGTVGALVQTVEREIAANITTLRVLATSPTLATGDYRGFHERARLALAGTGANIFVMDRGLETLLSTRRDYDDVRSRTADPASAELAFSSGAVVISDVLVGAESRRLVYNILMPVAPAGAAPVVVALNQEAAGLSSALLAIRLPAGWEVGLVDAKGTLVAGSPGAGETGMPFRLVEGAPLIEADGWQAVRAENETLRIITRRSPLTNWTLVAWAPEWVITQPLVISIAWLFGGGFLVGLATIAAIYWLSLRIGRSVKLLAEDAQRLGSGEAVLRRAYPISEIATVADAIGDAAEARQAALAEIRFLMRELAHRSKNQMTVIAAMAKQTARSATSVPEFVAAFERRIMGLAGSTDLLLAHGMAGVELGALLRRQLEPFTDLDTGRVQLSGPAVRLNAQSAQIVGMAAHELATNAVKYGAFSTEAGRLTVDWQVEGEHVALSWREHVPVPPQPSSRRGFGTTVLETMVGRSLSAEVGSTLHPDGMEWRFRIPLAALDPVLATPAEDAAVG
ncbi:Two-component sensor histidine kinase, contains HisKA and HATPase domains [Devosia enhydra]|uniref:histidine kinase n=1 Tax=Devosia enhydra TaxID=665118 RepID=A0A1K2HYF7_9HYPH|nr:Two-component sensor histidine kinase, contains HisKA and HATPase domains [Devosia enhydra]